MTLLEIEFRAMGCAMYAAIDAEAQHMACASAALARLPGCFEAWEQCLSRFRAESELSRVNRSCGVWVAVSAVFWDVLQAALHAARASAGLVLPTLLPPLLAAGYDRSFESLGVVPIVELPQTDLRTSVDGIELNSARRELRLAPDVQLDFGGIAKGWCADTAVRHLADFDAVIVDAGGDVAVGGQLATEDRMVVGVANPFRSGQMLATLALGSCGVATSGRERRRWEQGGEQRHHIIDPRIGQPARTEVLSATVIAPTCAHAEMAAKRTFILGAAAGLAWLDTQPELAGMLILDSGAQLESQRWQSYVCRDTSH